jgi:hypothetical protein
LMLMILIMLCVRTKSFKNGGASFSKLSCHWDKYMQLRSRCAKMLRQWWKVGQCNDGRWLWPITF